MNDGNVPPEPSEAVKEITKFLVGNCFKKSDIKDYMNVGVILEVTCFIKNEIMQEMTRRYCVKTLKGALIITRKKEGGLEVDDEDYAIGVNGMCSAEDVSIVESASVCEDYNGIVDILRPDCDYTAGTKTEAMGNTGADDQPVSYHTPTPADYSLSTNATKKERIDYFVNEFNNWDDRMEALCRYNEKLVGLNNTEIVWWYWKNVYPIWDSDIEVLGPERKAMIMKNAKPETIARALRMYKEHNPDIAAKYSNLKRWQTSKAIAYREAVISKNNYEW